MATGLTVKVLEVPVFVEVSPVKVMLWPLWATVIVMLTVLVPPVVLADIGVAPASAKPKLMVMFSLASPPVVMSLLYWSRAWMVTLKETPTV